MSGNKIIITSHNQQGGITAHTVNIGPQQRSLSNPNTAQLKEQMLREFPRDKPIDVMCVMGDSESATFAVEIHAFLAQNGFNMAYPRISQAVFADPQKGLSIDRNSNPVRLTVGSA
jgi:hypothetical protein